MAACTPAPEPTLIETSDHCMLELRRHRGSGAPVLLVHGASAQSGTFRIGETETLVECLVRQGFDVWTLDWRASMRLVKNIYCANPSTDFTIDRAATEDVPTAIRVMRRNFGITQKIALLGHCMGGAIVTQGIAQGVIGVADVETVVVTALALFYRAAIDNLLKAQDGVLEELLLKQALLHPTTQWVDDICHQNPRDGDWDPLLQRPYEVWKQTPLRHHPCDIAICPRLSYMFGMPYLPDTIPTIHARCLPSQFGYIPVQFLLHCTQNLRRGYAAPFEPNARRRMLASTDVYLQHEPFRDLKLTLITGDLNSLWHRDSIDTMYEWLLRGQRSARPRDEVVKRVIPGYGHQDLYWGLKAPSDVFPQIVEGLRR